MLPLSSLHPYLYHWILKHVDKCSFGFHYQLWIDCFWYLVHVKLNPHADAFRKSNEFPRTSFRNALYPHKLWQGTWISIMHSSVYLASVNLACFPFRIKLSTKKDQEAVINSFKNSMMLKIYNGTKQNWGHWAL